MFSYVSNFAMHYLFFHSCNRIVKKLSLFFFFHSPQRKVKNELGKNLLQSESRSVMSDSLLPPGLYSPWNSSGQDIGVGSRSLLQGIFPTQGSNPSLLHRRWILDQLSHQGNPRTLEWAAYPSPADLPNLNR